MILQKATELGVRTVQPVDSQNTALPAAKMKKLAERGEPIIRNAAQQCGAAWLPEIRPLCTFSEMLPSLRAVDAAVIGSLHAGAEPFRNIMHSLKPVQTAALLIGPEGDFTAEEVNCAVEAGARPVTFGDRILRTETAALFGLSVLVYELF
jgi:16S rRNA (uracil1498-N3)-methyltransferase